MTTSKRKCCYCNRFKERHLYHADQWKLRKSAPICKSCRKKHSESYKKSRDNYYRKTYGITLEEYESLLHYQSGRCAICRKKPGKRRLAVDHDHREAELSTVRESVRGLLCHKCNEYLGHIGDDWEYGLNIFHYLDRWPTKRSGVLR